LGMPHAHPPFFAQYGPPGCTRNTSSPLVARRYIRRPALRFGIPTPSLTLSAGSRAQPLLHLVVVYETSLLYDGLAAREHNKVGNPAHLEPRRELRIGFGVHLQHQRFSSHVRRGLRDLRSCGPARPAPGRPEIDKHWYRRILDNFIKQGSVYRQWLRQRRKRRLTGSTPSCAAQMLGADSVFLVALRASSNDRHGISTVNLDPFYSMHQPCKKIRASFGRPRRG